MTPDLALTPRRSLLSCRREVIGIFLLATLLPLFFIKEPIWQVFFWIPDIANLGHTIFFALLTLLIHGRYPLTSPRRWLVITAAILILSTIIELVQGQIGRTASVADVMRNLLGTWLVIAWQGVRSRTAWWPRVLLTSLLLIELAGVAMDGIHRYRVYMDFPALSTMEKPAAMQQWLPLSSRLSRSTTLQSEGTYALRAELLPGDYSGAILTNFPATWQNYRQLQLDVYNAQQQTLICTLRLHDKLHEVGTEAWRHSDRFNHSLPLKPGWNQIIIKLQDVEQAPENRLMDLAQMRELRLFITDNKKPKVIYIDNLRLTSD